MRHLFRRLRIGHQIAIAGGLVALPMIALVVRDVSDHAARIDVARAELAGLGALSSHRALLEALPQHRAAVQMRLDGAVADDARIEALSRQVDALMMKVRWDSKLAAPQSTSTKVDPNAQWRRIKNGWRDRTAVELVAWHAQLMAAIGGDMDRLAHRSGLLPSQSPESYRLAQLVVTTVPALIRSLDEALATGQARFAGKTPASDVAAPGRLPLSLDPVGARLREAVAAQGLAETLGRLDADLERLAAAERALAAGSDPGLSMQAFVALGDQALASALVIYDALGEALAQHLADRISGLETERTVEIVALVCALVLIGLLLAIVVRNITRPIGRVVEVCRRLGSGRYDEPLDRDVGGDMGVVIGALADLQDELAHETRTRQEAQREGESLRDQFVQAQKREALGTLASGIAHDFNNVIAAIIGQAELAVFAAQSGKPVEDRLRRVVNAGLGAKAIVQQILSFARPDATVETKAVLPSQVLHETVDLAETGIPATVRITRDIDDNVGAILINPSQCHQFLLNVLVNAGHAVNDNGGAVACGLRSVDGPEAAAGPFFTAPGDKDPPRNQLWSGELGDTRYAHFWVADGGVGMDRETMVRIFDPFFTTRTDGEGSGLGLSAAQGIVLAAGGAIHVGSTPGIGTRFDIYLPVGAEADPAAAPTAAMAGPPARHVRVMLVDDNADALDALATVLRRRGHQVDVHNNGAAALVAFRAAPSDVDIVVTDHNMADLTGLALIEKIRTERPGLPAVLTTGRTDTAFRSEAMEAGIDAFLEKPFQADVLCETIDAVLDRATAPASPEQDIGQPQRDTRH